MAKGDWTAAVDYVNTCIHRGIGAGIPEFINLVQGVKQEMNAA